jgi:O-antigen ligase
VLRLLRHRRNSGRYDLLVLRLSPSNEAIEPSGVTTPSHESGGRAELIGQAFPLAAILLLVLLMVVREGGFAGTVRYPVTLVVLGLCVTVVGVGARRVATLPRTVAAAVGCLAAFTVWSYASILWAADRGAAWDGSNRCLLYLLVFMLIASWPAEARAVWPVLLAGGAVVCLEGVVTVERALSAGNTSSFFIGNRLSEPLGYPNATAALFMIVAWLMIGLASRKWIPAPARAVAFGLAPLALTLNLFAESRGSIFTLPLVFAGYLALVPGRLRSLWTIGIVALGFLPVVGPVLRVYSADPSQLDSRVTRALALALVWSLLVAVAGWLFAVVDRRAHPSARSVRITAVTVVVCAVLAAAGVAGATRPWHASQSLWHSFRYGGEPGGTASHFGGLGSHRYDFWRVGLIEFERHPVQGIGTDNFVVPYLQLRRSDEEPLYPHSLPVRLLSQSGVVGTLLFGGFLALTLLTVARIPAGPRRELAGVLAAAAGVWLLHGMVDWLWEMPALGVLGTVLLAAGCGLAPRRPAPSRSLRRLGRYGVAACGALLVVTLAATLVFPWITERDIRHAASVWRADPAEAFSILGQAHDLNPLSDQADLVAGAIASRLHDYPKMRSAFAAAVGRSPDDWYANLELGISASLTGERGLAADSLGRAHLLNPGDPIVRDVLATFKAGRRIDSDRVDRAFAEQD